MCLSLHVIKKHNYLVNELIYVYMYMYVSNMCIYVYADYELINEAVEFKCNETTIDSVINDTILTMQKHRRHCRRYAFILKFPFPRLFYRLCQLSSHILVALLSWYKRIWLIAGHRVVSWQILWYRHISYCCTEKRYNIVSCIVRWKVPTSSYFLFLFIHVNCFIH